MAQGNRFKSVPLYQRFFEKVDTTELDGCWLWTGSTDRKGYGSLRERGRAGHLLKAHRVSWLLHHGEIRDGLNVLHHCDNPRCVRPDHLFLGTLSDNSQDAARKGRLIFQKHPERAVRGEQHRSAKLTSAKVSEIKQLSSSGWSQNRLAKRFGVSQAAIWFVLHRRTWKAEP